MSEQVLKESETLMKGGGDLPLVASIVLSTLSMVLMKLEDIEERLSTTPSSSTGPRET